MERQTVSIKEAAQQFGLHYEAVYRAVRKGEIPAIRIGGRILIPKAVMVRLLADPGPLERQRLQERRQDALQAVDGPAP